ncbi:hypothetical protein [uncultured Chitinophaga sp.]|uniref:hypothetical protein n=1 Tax=uncultured Chitinophaga sp. TaxID=339340 RepID=UPI0025D16B64|nr:hypothetical protein [uncultured Chitinophaga sp.]
MKKNIISRLFTAVKILCIAVWALSCTMLVAFKADKLYADVWAQLGLSQSKATTNIKGSFLSGYLQFYGARNIKNIAAGDRQAVTKDLLVYTKQYVQGDEFRKEYDAYRSQQKPSAPAPPKTDEEVRTKYIKELKEGIANLEKGLQTMADPEMKKTIGETLTMFKQNLKDAEANKSDMLNMMIEGEKQTYDYRKKDFDNAMEAWEKTFPASSNAYIKLRLQEMLDATEGVDFNAQLTEKYGHKVFVNKTYESKNPHWKMAFRAGKDVTTTVRGFAQEWIKELK